MKHLGETFDIHGGGMDLIFPHHENEIAQSCGATGKEFARYWIHNGFVQINKEKMSKSLGNFFTIREIFEKSEWSEEVTGEILRYFLLSTHYHGPLDFSDQGLKEAKNALNGFYDLFRRLDEDGEKASDDEDLSLVFERCREAFRAAMDDDFNTPVAIAALQGLRNDVNKLLGRSLSTEGRRRAREEFRLLGDSLRLFPLDLDMKWQFKERVGVGAVQAQAVTVTLTGAEITSGTGAVTPSVKSTTVKETLSDAFINAKLTARIEAKKRKDFKRADEIRAELNSLGITIEDRPDGTSRWKR